jgi:hypothetical protein
LVVTIEQPENRPDAEAMGAFESNMKDIRKYIGYQRPQIDVANQSLEQLLSTEVDTRFARVQKRESLANMFGRPKPKTPEQLEVEMLTSKRVAVRPAASVSRSKSSYDVFVSHAWEDKDDFVRPLADALSNKGLKIWYDEHALTVGDSLAQEIDRGLAQSRFGVVILSPHFFAKDWPQRELDGLLAKEVGGIKVILPIWHSIDRPAVVARSPTLAGRLAARSSDGIHQVVDDLFKAIQKAR